MLLGAAVAALQSRPAGGPARYRNVAATVATSAPGSPGPSAAPGGQPAEDRVDERAERSELRSAPLASASPSVASAAEPTGPARTEPARTASAWTPQPAPGDAAVASSGTCQASYYSTGGHTANGEAFRPGTQLTAAHKTLPFNTMVRVTNLANGRYVVVRINDRGPFVAGRCLDLSTAAFQAIASLGSGVARVHYDVLA